MKKLSYVLSVIVIGVYAVQNAASMPAQSGQRVIANGTPLFQGVGPLTRGEVLAEDQAELQEMDLSIPSCDGMPFAPGGPACQNVPEEIQGEAETAGETYKKGEEHAENNERRRETERSFEGEKPHSAEETAENSEDVREIDASDSNEATEWIHETIRENHPDLGGTLLNILGAIGAVASIVGLVIVIK